MTTACASSETDRVQLGQSPAIHTDIPGIAPISAKIASGLGLILSEIHTGFGIEHGSLKTTTFANWQASQTPMIVAHFHDRLIKPGLSLAMPLALLARLTDGFYGGTGLPAAAQTCGEAEQRVFLMVAKRAAEVISTTWHETDGSTPTLTACSFETDQSAIFTPDDPVLIHRYDVTHGNAEAGELIIIYPCVGMRGRIQPPGPTSASKSSHDPVWQARLSEAVMETRVTVRTVIARPELSVARVLSLTVGDIIPITLPAWIPLTVAGRKLAHGSVGEANGRAAIKIHKFEQENRDHV